MPYSNARRAAGLCLLALSLSACASVSQLGPRVVETPLTTRSETLYSVGSLEVGQVQLQESQLTVEIKRQKLCQEQRTQDISHQKIQDNESKGVGAAAVGGLALMLASSVVIGGAQLYASDQPLFSDGSSSRTQLTSAGALGVAGSFYWLNGTWTAWRKGQDVPIGPAWITQEVERVGTPTLCGHEAAEPGQLLLSYGPPALAVVQHPVSSSFSVDLQLFAEQACSSPQALGKKLQLFYQGEAGAGTEQLSLGTWNADDCIRETYSRSLLGAMETASGQTSSLQDWLSMIKRLEEVKPLLSALQRQTPSTQELVAQQARLETLGHMQIKGQLSLALETFQRRLSRGELKEALGVGVAVLEGSRYLPSLRRELWAQVYSASVMKASAQPEQGGLFLASLLEADVETRACLRLATSCTPGLERETMVQTLKPAGEALVAYALTLSQQLEQGYAQLVQKPTAEGLTAFEALQAPAGAVVMACQGLMWEQMQLPESCITLSMRLAEAPAQLTRQREAYAQRVAEEAERQRVQALLEQVASAQQGLVERLSVLKKTLSEENVKGLQVALADGELSLAKCGAFRTEPPRHEQACASLEQTQRAALTFWSQASEAWEQKVREEAAKRLQQQKDRTHRAWYQMLTKCESVRKTWYQIQQVGRCEGECKKSQARAVKQWKELESFEVKDPAWDEDVLITYVNICAQLECPVCP